MLPVTAQIGGKRRVACLLTGGLRFLLVDRILAGFTLALIHIGLLLLNPAVLPSAAFSARIAWSRSRSVIEVAVMTCRCRILPIADTLVSVTDR